MVLVGAFLGYALLFGFTREAKSMLPRHESTTLTAHSVTRFTRGSIELAMFSSGWDIDSRQKLKEG